MPPTEVAKDGVVRIPKSVFESKPAPAPAADSSSAASSSSSAGVTAGKVTQVKRLDGTIEEVVTGLPPNNPNFAPRQCWPGGKIYTNDKLEVQLRFYERKGMPLTPELEAKKAELDAAAKEAGASKGNLAEKMGGGKKAKGKGGKAVKLGGGAAAAAATLSVPKASAEQSAWYKNRPKGGVKVLGGVEGVVAVGKRERED